jgi:hypothetical protein
MTLLVAGCASSHGAAQRANARSSASGPPAASRTAASGSAPGTGAPATASATAPAGVSGAPGATPGSGAASGGASGRPTATPSAWTIAVKASLVKSCVVPGGTQTLILDTRPAAQIAADTVYTDKKDGRVHGGYTPNGTSDRAGHFTYTWTIAVDTPPGEAYTLTKVTKGNERGRSIKAFRVAVVC